MIKNKKEIQGNEVFAQGLQSDIASEQLNDILGKDIVSSDISQSDESGEIRQSLDFLEKEKESYIHVDKEFGRFLSNYVDIQQKKEEQKLHFKDQFFWFVMISFFALMLTPFVLSISIGRFSDITVIISFVTALIEVVSAIIVLPKIIAKYLFDPEEDKHLIHIIRSMQQYNEKKHRHIDKE